MSFVAHRPLVLNRINQEIRAKCVLNWDVVSGWRSVTAVLLKVGGGACTYKT